MPQEINILLQLKSSEALKNLNDFVGHASHYLREFAGAMGIAFSVERVVEMGKQFIEAEIRMRQMAQMASVTTEEMSGLAFAADVNNLSTEQLTRSIKSLSEWMVKMGQGGKDIKSELLDQAEAFSKMADGARKNTLAVERFGRSGLQMIPFLNQGREGLSELIEKGELFSGMSSEGAERAHELEIALKELKLSLSALVGSMATAVGGLAHLAEGLANVFAIAKLGFSTKSNNDMVLDAVKNLLGQFVKGATGNLTTPEMTKEDFEQQKKQLEVLLKISQTYQKQLEDPTQTHLSPDDRVARINRELATQIDLYRQIQNLTNRASDIGAISKTDASLANIGTGAQSDTLRRKIEPETLGGSMKQTLDKMVEDWGTASKNIATIFKSTIQTSINSISSGISGLILGTLKWRDALKQIGTSIINELVNGIVKMGVTWVVQHLIMGAATKAFHALGIALGWESVAQVQAQEASKAPALATNAATASIGSYGTAAIVGLALAVAAIAAVIAMASHREMGGEVSAGRPYIVGEKRAELFVPRSDGYIMSSVPRGSSLSRGSDPINMNVEVHNWNDERAMTEHIRNNPDTHHVILDKVKRNGHYVGIRQ